MDGHVFEIAGPAELALEELARELHWEMERLDPTDAPDWEARTEHQRQFYRLCVDHLIRQPEARVLVASQ